MDSLYIPEHLLLHTCCAPCLIAPYYELKAQGISFSSFWYNPNVHPVTEYRMRLQTLQSFVQKEGIFLVLKDDYGLRNFVKGVASNIEERCEYCFRSRLEMTAQTALEQGYDAFSTTLLYSIYQKHDLIKEIGEEIAEEKHIPFFYRDWRPLWSVGVRLSKEAELYRQKYCGCIFSEEERYLKRKK